MRTAVRFFVSDIRFLFRKAFPDFNHALQRGFLLIFSILLLAESGYSYISDTSNSRLLMIVLLAFAFCVFVLWAFNLRLSRLQQIVKTKKVPKPSFIFCLFIFLLLMILLSFLFCKDKSLNYKAYIGLASVVACSFFFVSSVPFKTFCRYFVRALGVICVVTLIFFFTTSITKIPFSTSSYFHLTYLKENYLFLYFDFGKVVDSALKTSSSDRLMGPFWEPGVFATMLLVGLIVEFVPLKKNKNWFLIVLFSLCLFLTFSTAGWLIFPFVVLLWFTELPKGKLRTGVLIGSGVLIVVSILISFFVFRTKFSLQNSSFYTRIYSFYYFWLVFIRNPFLGQGPVTAFSIYYSLGPSLLTAGTSTVGYLLASIGFAGFFFLVVPFIGIAKDKSMSLLTRIVLILSIFLLTNKENHFGIYALMFFIFYLCSNIHFKWEEKRIADPEDTLFQTYFVRRSRGLASNVGWSFFVKVIGMLVGLITIPIYSLYFQNNTSYGVWLTIISILTWILLFDFGISNGLRTALPKALSSQDDATAKRSVFLTYRISIIVGLIVSLVGIVLAFTLDWNSIFNVGRDVITPRSLSITLCFVFATVGFQFALRPIVAILDSLGMSGVGGGLQLLSNVMLLIFALVGSNFAISDRFVGLAIFYFFAIMTPLIIATIYVFTGPFADYRPSKHSAKGGADRQLFKQMMGINSLFFIIQLTDLFLNGFNDLIITQMFGPDSVTSYTEYYKLFSFIATAFTSVFQAPFWVAISKAEKKNDINTINRLSKILHASSIAFGLACALLGGCLNFVFFIWLGDNSPTFSWLIDLVFTANSLITIGICCFTMIGNGMGAIKSQVVVYSIAAILKIPLVFLLNYFFKDTLSFSAVILANAILLAPALIALPLEIRAKKKKIREKHIDLVDRAHWTV